MVKLATLHLVQPIGVRFMSGSPINQEVGAPPPLGFPHTMLSVKKVKDNMCLAFIEKLLPIARSGLTCRQNTCASRVCRMRVKVTCVTLVMFSSRKL
jgi:hypothetical protein